MANLHVNQKNSKGDNIFASDNANIDIKNITIKSIASQDLADFATKVLILITRRDFSQVNTYLQAISTITGLDRDCIKLITILRYRLAYAQAKPFEIEKTIFTHLLNVKDLDPTLEDIIQSSFLAFMSKTSIETAIVKFSTLENKGCYTNEVYYELIADDLELDALDELELIELTEHEVCAYVRFFLRKQNFEKAFELSTYLHKEYNNQNSQATIVGHTDNTGNDAINNPLSVNRAANTRQYIASQGIASNRINIDGRGSYEPIASNDSPLSRAKNRRVEVFVFEPNQQAQQPQSAY